MHLHRRLRWALLRNFKRWAWRRFFYVFIRFFINTSQFSILCHISNTHSNSHQELRYIHVILTVFKHRGDGCFFVFFTLIVKYLTTLKYMMEIDWYQGPGERKVCFIWIDIVWVHTFALYLLAYTQSHPTGFDVHSNQGRIETNIGYHLVLLVTNLNHRLIVKPRS